MDKEIKGLIKCLKRHYLMKYQQVVNYLLNSEDTPEEKQNNINLLISNEKYYADELEAIKLNLELQAKEEEFQSKIDNKVTTQERMLEYVNEQITLNNEELMRVTAQPETSTKGIERKQKTIAKLTTRLDNLATCKKRVEELIKELQPEKRKVGRPKKVKEEPATTEEQGESV